MATRAAATVSDADPEPMLQVQTAEPVAEFACSHCRHLFSSADVYNNDGEFICHACYAGTDTRTEADGLDEEPLEIPDAEELDSEPLEVSPVFSDDADVATVFPPPQTLSYAQPPAGYPRETPSYVGLQIWARHCYGMAKIVMILCFILAGLAVFGGVVMMVREESLAGLLSGIFVALLLAIAGYELWLLYTAIGDVASAVRDTARNSFFWRR